MLVAPEVLMEKSHSITHLKLFQQDIKHSNYH